MDKKLLATLTLTILSGSALAIPTYYDFSALDTNKDGYLSTEEYQGYQNTLQKDFGQADISGDSKISLDEFKVSSKIQLDPLMNALPSGAAVSEQRVQGASGSNAATGDTASGSSASGSADTSSAGQPSASTDTSGSASAGKQVRGAELMKKDTNVQGELKEDVMKATDPTVLQGGESGDISDPSGARGSGSSSKQSGGGSGSAGSNQQ